MGTGNSTPAGFQPPDVNEFDSWKQFMKSDSYNNMQETYEYLWDIFFVTEVCDIQKLILLLYYCF